MTVVLIVAICYTMGAIPFGLVIGKLTGHIDVRQVGSGNTGVTNVLRSAGMWPAIIVLLLDSGKGALAVLLARMMDPIPINEVIAAVSVLLGHNWSMFLGFQGGKGTATGIGSILAISPLCAGVVLLVGLPLIAVSRYVSLGSVVGAITALVSMYLLAVIDSSIPFGVQSMTYVSYPVLGMPIILYKHRSNMLRLLNRTERKLGESINIKDSS